MPKPYARRFAQLISEDPLVLADYAVQSYDPPFAEAVAAELALLGLLASVDPHSGVLHVTLPTDHPMRKRQEDQFAKMKRAGQVFDFLRCMAIAS